MPSPYTYTELHNQQEYSITPEQLRRQPESSGNSGFGEASASESEAQEEQEVPESSSTPTRPSSAPSSPNSPDQHANPSHYPELSPTPTSVGGTTLDPENPAEQSKTHRNYFDWAGSWTWKIGAGLLSVICVGLLIGFLVYVDGGSYDLWQYSVSPNAVVSIILTVAKSAMLVTVSGCLSQLKWDYYRTPKPLSHIEVLDQATRGPWGSLEVLFRVAPGLSTVGAVLTILSVAIDPFGQQILAFPSRSTLALNETAFIQKTQEYRPTIRWYTVFSLPSMQVAIISGLSQTDTPLEPECSTSNCTYPRFSTLGFCSRCRDVTNQSSPMCVPDLTGHANKVDMILSQTQRNNILMNCTYKVPDTEIRITSNFSVSRQSNRTIHVSRVSQDYFATDRSASTPVFGISDPVIAIAGAKYGGQDIIYTPDSENITLPRQPNITLCILYYCEKQYPPSDSHHLPQPTKTQPLIVNWGSQTEGDTMISMYPPAGAKIMSGGSGYEILGLAYHGIYNQLQEMIDFASPNATFRWGSSGNSAIYPPKNRSLEGLTNSLATSMTDAIRESWTLMVPGKAYRPETFIHVRWPWIILPASVVVLSVLLLIVTVAASKRSHWVLWKSSQLPLLLGRLKTQDQHTHDIDTLQNVDEMKLWSKKVKVSMADMRSVEFVEH